MTDRIRTLTVVLDNEYRTDDVQAIVDAIQMTKGVSTVMLGQPVDPHDYLARQAVAIKYADVLRNFAALMVQGKDIKLAQ